MFAPPLLQPLNAVLQKGNDRKDQWTAVWNNVATIFRDCNLHSVAFLFYISWNTFSTDLQVQWDCVRRGWNVKWDAMWETHSFGDKRVVLKT